MADDDRTSPREFGVQVSEDGDGRTLVAVSGEVDVYTAPRLRDCLYDLIGDGKMQLVIDFSDMDFIDSTGLHAIVESVRTAKSVGRKLKLSAELPAHARRLMEIVGLLPFIPIAPD